MTQRRSIMRRQKMKMGTCSALRKIAFTVGKEETDQFQRQQDELAEHSCDAVSARYAVVSVREGIASSHLIQTQVAAPAPRQEDGGPPRDGCDLVRAFVGSGRVPDGAPARAPGADAASSVILNLNL